MYERYKKMYDPMYKISICKKDEIDDVVEFIDKYWKKDHALVKSRSLMDWQYYNEQNQTYNFIIARNKATGEIHAIEGFISTSHFDPQISKPMTWGSIWKAIPDVAPPGLGFVVKKYRETEYDSEYNCEVGISVDAKKYNTQFKNTIFALNNWYITNPDIEKYELVECKSHQSSVSHDNNYSNVAYIDIDPEKWYLISDDLRIPEFKSKDYYANRFFNHPIYKYHAVTLFSSDTEEREVVFYRVLEHSGRKSIFFVDYIGNGHVLKGANSVLVKLLGQYEAEYIVFPCFGVDVESLKEAGFLNPEETEDVIPLYYEPFLKKNVEILCASKMESINWMTFKGDADQDRPNIIM